MIKNIKPWESFRLPTVVTGKDYNKIEDFIRDSINNYLSNGTTKEFCVQDLFGGENWDWSENNFPIQKYYDYYYKKYITKFGHDKASAKAIKQAGISVGWVTKYVVHYVLNDNFKIRREFRRIVYTKIN